MWDLPNILKTVQGNNDQHEIYHNFLASKALVCIVELVETRFPAEVMMEFMHSKANEDIFV